MASLESVPFGWGAGTDLERGAQSPMAPGILCSIPKSDVSLIHECPQSYLLLQVLHGAGGRGHVAVTRLIKAPQQIALLFFLRL